MNAVSVVGWIGIIAGCIVLLNGAYVLLGELAWRAEWKWGDRRKLRRAVKLGWNTGLPPDGSLFLAIEYANQVTRHADFMSNHRWAVMKRVGDRAYTVCGGMNEPITNVTGWLEVIDGEAQP